jgi:putative Holliday junction resolvase
MARILAIDYGQKRSGIAITDPMQIIANSLTTVPSSELIGFLKDYLRKESVDLFVVGYPKQMNNSPSEAVIYVDVLIQKLKLAFPDKEIVLMDERFTSKMAVQAMIEGGVKKKARQNKALVDAVSAAIILQSYLDLRDAMKNKI